MAESVVTIFEAENEQYKKKVEELINSVDKLTDKEQANLAKSRLAINSKIKAIDEENKKIKELEALQKKAFTPEAVKHFQKEIDASKLKVQQLSAEIRATQGNISSLANKSVPEVKKVGSAFGSIVPQLKNIAGILGVTFAATQLIGFGKEAVELAAKTEGVRRAFDNLNRPGLLDELRKATKGTVNDLELMQAAVRADKFQIPLEQLGTLLNFAKVRAQETGQSVDYLVESIVNGIGRKSPLILDNLGISAVRLRNEFKGIGVEAATVGDVAAVVGRIAQEELAKVGDQALTTKDKLAQIQATFDNIKVAIGESLIEALGIAGKEVSRLGDTFSSINQTIGELTGNSGFNLFSFLLNNIAKSIGQVFEAANQLAKGFDLLVKGLNFLKDAGVGVISVFEEIGNTFANAFKDFDITNPFKSINFDSFSGFGQRAANAFADGFKGGVQGDIFDDALDATKLKDISVDVKITQSGKSLKELQEELKGLQEELLLLTVGSDAFNAKLKQINALEDVIKKALGELEPPKTAMQRLNEEIARLKSLLDDQALKNNLNPETMRAYAFALEQAKKAQEEFNKLYEQFKDIEPIDASGEAIKKFTEENKKAIQSNVDASKQAMDDELKARAQNIEDQKKLEESLKQTDKELAEQRLKNIESLKTALFDLATAYVDFFRATTEAEIQSLEAQREARNTSYDEALAALEDRVNKGTISETLAAQKSIQIQEAKRKSEEQIQKKINEQKRKQAIADKALSVANIIRSTAEAIMTTLAITGFFGVALTGIVAAIGALQLATVLSTPIPSFYEGTPYVKRGRNKKGRDTIPAMLNEGERVVPTAQNERYFNVYEKLERPGKLKSIFDAIEKDRLEEFLFNPVAATPVAPQLRKAKEKKESHLREEKAKMIGQSIMNISNSKGVDEYGLFRANEYGVNIREKSIKKLAEVINNDKKSYH